MPTCTILAALVVIAHRIRLRLHQTSPAGAQRQARRGHVGLERAGAVAPRLISLLETVDISVLGMEAGGVKVQVDLDRAHLRGEAAAWVA
eukprot:5853576-Prymnesium_polylepis.1